jgi:NosR/NirI family transcriptional regulator, nitrous oxide reductase regulator
LSRFTAAAVVLALLTFTVADGQVVDEPGLLAQLEQLFPDAASFAAKSGTPPHYKALGPSASGQDPKLLGYAYWTTELEPLERGFDGPIKMLVGLNLEGEITGVIVTDHREPYGYFSVDLPDWPKQFEGKSIKDSFKVGTDVDAISRATISVTSASRAIRNSSRKIARAYLAPPESPPAGAAGPAAATQ